MVVRQLIVSAFLIFAISCSDDDKKVACDFDNSPDQEEGWLDQEEQDIMNECSENRLQSKSEIESNLIGTWKIVGFVAGWIATVPSPCGVLTVTDKDMTLEYRHTNIDTTIVMSYEVVEGENNFFTLETTPSFYALSMSIFCKDIMYGNHFVIDGDLHIYEKVD